jgi:hypothetical protein
MIANPVPVGEYEVLPQYHSQPKRLKIIHVGAGASGLLLAYKAERQLQNYELICYEKYVVVPPRSPYPCDGLGPI